MRLFFLFTGVALLLTGCFSPWLWAPNLVTGAVHAAGAISQSQDSVGREALYSPATPGAHLARDVLEGAHGQQNP